MRILCRESHSAGEAGSGQSVNIPVGCTGVLLSHDKMRSLSVLAAILDDLGDKSHRFVAWDVLTIHDDSVIVTYEADRLDALVIRLMPPAKDAISATIAGECRKELADLYECYRKLELAASSHVVDKTLGEKLKLLIDAVASGIKENLR